MGADAYHWTIEARGSEWRWSISRQVDGTCLVSGTAQSRPHAAACVVRALIHGVTVANHQPLAA